MKFKLMYFDGAYGRAELIRFILQYGGADYEDFLVKRADWPDLKETTPMGQMPALVIDGDRKLGQSMAITRYLAKMFGLTPKDDFQNAQCDMFTGGIDDLYNCAMPYFKAKFGGNADQAKEEWDKFRNEGLKNFMDRYEKFLATNGTGYLVGSELTWADIAVAEMVKRLADCFDKEILSAGYPELNKLVARVHDLPKIKAYLEKRPKNPF